MSISIDRIEGALGKFVESLAAGMGERLEITERCKVTSAGE
jgi:hypothetical protein